MSFPHWNDNQFNARVDGDLQYTNQVVLAAPGSSQRYYITDIDVNMGASGRDVQVLDGSGGTVLWEATPGNNGYQCVNFKVPLQLTAGTGIYLTTGGTSVGFFIAVNGFVS